MRREQILSVLYDLSLTIGSELDLDTLLRKSLQRLLFHTSFPVAVALSEPQACAEGDSACMAAAIGDYMLSERVGSRFTLPAGLLGKEVALLADARLLQGFALDQQYTHCLRLPVDQDCCILLLALAEPASDMPLTQVFQPLLGNLSRALMLCRNNARLTQRLAEDRDQARAETHAKSDFLASMSHEIRAPLNVVLGATHLARRAESAEKRDAALSRIEGAGKHLLSVVDDILDLSRIEAGKLTLAPQAFLAGDVLREVASLLADKASEKQLNIRCDFPSGLPLLLGDVARLRQILLNFANNALKFTAQGEVILRARSETALAGLMRLRLEVEDSGMGIAPEVLARLFEPFRQADAAIYRQFGGSGLGLMISRQLARLMGGEAGACSEPGQGSIFWVELPLPLAPLTADSAQPSLPSGDALEDAVRALADGRSILLAEDEPINAEIVSALLAEVGWPVTAVANGQAALDALSTGSYALVLMDMQMPVMDGLEATRRLRSQPAWAHLPVVAMTANVFTEDKQACLAAGMNDFLTKPVDPEAFYLAIYRWLVPAG